MSPYAWIMMEIQGGIITHKSQGIWHWHLGGSIASRLGQKCVSLAWRHDVTQWFIWDPVTSIQMPPQWTDVDCLRESNLGEGGFVMFPFQVPLMMHSRWISRVGGSQFIGAEGPKGVLRCFMGGDRDRSMYFTIWEFHATYS